MPQTTTSAGITQNPVLSAVKSWWNLLFKKKKQQPVVDSKYDSQYFRDLDMTFKTLKFWTPELIEWVGKENDPIRLSCTSHLLNCHEWPDYLPSKPDNYMDFTKGEEYDLRLHFCCELLGMLDNKANVLSPGLSHKIWLTHFFRMSPNGEKLSPQNPKTTYIVNGVDVTSFAKVSVDGNDTVVDIIYPNKD